MPVSSVPIYFGGTDGFMPSVCGLSHSLELFDFHNDAACVVFYAYL